MANRKRLQPSTEPQRRTAEIANLFMAWLDLVPSAQKPYVPAEAQKAEKIAARMRELAEQNRQPAQDEES